MHTLRVETVIMKINSIMNKLDLDDFITFVKDNNLMNEPIKDILPLWNREVEKYYEEYEDIIDDFWIDADDEFI